MTIFDPENVQRAFSKWRLKDPSDDRLTIVNQGRLGNVMFQYASLLAIALRNGKRPFVFSSNIIRGTFDVSFVEDVDTKQWLQIKERQFAAYCPEMANLPKGSFQLVQMFQSWRYFEPIKQEIRKELKFKEEHEQAGGEMFRHYTAPYRNRTIIALHVRRTDMNDTTESSHGHTMAPLSYIRKAILHMQSKFRTPVFLIATDDKDWCRTHLAGPDMVLMYNDNPHMDLVAMSMCDHVIMTVGTFGWWAAWLVGGYTIYYNGYPKEGSIMAREFVKEDFFQPHWIPMGA
ncbi:galactoside alpha-(1,2)-fucosyltransferase 1-like [Haliotis rufescens]|uniref:galactoside alpha-(1,2)-fucosyltransferase 1-like n=1 Tax=Haliotis rufescens TaxID=6454 RepID=UPI001EB02D50|nr:galactoside alpha-(1,2)-fucosyltransferase 1-like [Haliotis rufescens]